MCTHIHRDMVLYIAPGPEPICIHTYTYVYMYIYIEIHIKLCHLNVMFVTRATAGLRIPYRLG